MVDFVKELLIRIYKANVDAGKQDDRVLDNKISYNYAIETKTWIDDLYSLGNVFIGGNENTNVVNESEQKIYKSNNLMNTLSLKNFFEKIIFHNLFFADTQYEFVGFTGLTNNGAGNPYVEPIFKQDFIQNGEFATSVEISNHMKKLGFFQAEEFKFRKDGVEVSDIRPRNVLKDKIGNLYIIDGEFKTGSFDGKKGISLNQFHQESIERNIKAIRETKKTPMNYEQELGRHRMMHRNCP